MFKKFLFTTFSISSILMLVVMGAGKPLSAAAAPLVQDGLPTMTSDQADYPPGATVTLTGANWQGDTDVRIVVNDDVGQTWSRDVVVPVAEDGAIVDSFSLPSYFVATYRVVASGQQTGRAVTYTFTDSPTRITAQQHEGQLKVGGVLGGYTSGNVTEYTELDTINFRFELDATHGPSSGQLEVLFTGDESPTCRFFQPLFTLGTIENLGGPQPTVSVATGPTASGTEWVVVLNISYPTTFDHVANLASVNYTLTLSDQAGECSGSSQHSRLNTLSGHVQNSGAQNVPVPANQIIELPEITVIKQIDRDGNGSFESTAAAGEYCFTLDSGSCVPTNSSGQVVFTNVTPNGTHSITETQLNFSQGTYDFDLGSGMKCSTTQPCDQSQDGARQVQQQLGLPVVCR